jgi:hypothetical protein
LFLQNKDLSEDSYHPKQIGLHHDVGSDAEMEDDAHDGTDTYENDAISNVDYNDDHDHDGDDDVEAVAGSSQ